MDSKCNYLSMATFKSQDYAISDAYTLAYCVDQNVDFLDMTISLVQLFQYTSGIILPTHQWFVSTNGCFNQSQCNSYLNTIFDKSKHTECMNVPLCVNNINDGLLFIIIVLIAT